ncbi:MAG: hypothetical protein LAP21_03400 [Acidobacteriia bacterium]|nr:hypothetical protein [Terriglobia bacterium]
MGASLKNAPAIKKKLLVVKAVMVSVFLTFLTLGVGHIVERSGLAWIEENGAALLIGVLGGFIFYCLVLQDAVVREVNHHVRNALQVMLYPEDAGDVPDALKRIDWTLTDVIRGRFETGRAEEEEMAAVTVQPLHQPVTR